jgi:transposase
MQVEIYNRIKEVLEIEPTRVDIDLTAVHFEGNKCIMAKFGYSPPKQQGKKQIVVSVAVDQNGIPLTHIVFPGNRTSKKSLKRIDRILREEFEVKRAVRVGDRGFSTDENIKYMDRNKESYLLALEMNNKEQEIAREVHTQETWTTINDDVKVTELIKHENGRDKKYLIGFDRNRAKDVKKAREAKIKNTEEDLARCQRAIAQGKIKSRKNRDKRIGNILKKNSVGRFIGYQGHRKGYGFRFWRMIENIRDAESRDGIYVMVTTETRLTAQDMLESYRERDRIEKAIRVLKDILEIEPQYVYTKEHVLGHVFICVLAYQIRSVMRYMLKQNGTDMSIDEAFDVLERLKVVNITINDDKVKTYRKLTSVDGSIMTLMEIFKIPKEDIELALL